MTGPQDELAVRLAYDEVADTYANRFPSTEPEFGSTLRWSTTSRPSFPANDASWTYSTTHTPHVDLPRVMSEVRRVLRPGGLSLIAFRSGRGVRDVSNSYRRYGHDIVLHRYNRAPEQIAHAARQRA